MVFVNNVICSPCVGATISCSAGHPCLGGELPGVKGESPVSAGGHILVVLDYVWFL